jgi:hypothetical protein
MKSMMLVWMIGGCLHAVSQNPTFPPIHDLDKDPSLVQFLEKFKRALEDKDEAFIISVLDEEVRGSLDSDGGKQDFIATWELHSDSSLFWNYTLRLLDIGGAFLDDPYDASGRYQVVFPYIYLFEPGIEDDPYALGCVTGQQVNLREKPDLKAAVVTKLNYDVIWFVYPEDGAETQSGVNEFNGPLWYLIETYDRRYKGWVYWKYVYSMIGPRFFLFRDSSKNWRISAFVTGD